MIHLPPTHIIFKESDILQCRLIVKGFVVGFCCVLSLDLKRVHGVIRDVTAIKRT